MNTLTVKIASSWKEALYYQEDIENSLFFHNPLPDYETDYVMLSIAKSVAEGDMELYICSKSLFDIIRIAVGEGHIPAANVKVFFGIENPEEVIVREDGSIANWPPKMFDVETRRAKRLADCRRAKA